MKLNFYFMCSESIHWDFKSIFINTYCGTFLQRGLFGTPISTLFSSWVGHEHRTRWWLNPECCPGPSLKKKRSLTESHLSKEFIVPKAISTNSHKMKAIQSWEIIVPIYLYITWYLTSSHSVMVQNFESYTYPNLPKLTEYEWVQLKVWLIFERIDNLWVKYKFIMKINFLVCAQITYTLNFSLNMRITLIYAVYILEMKSVWRPKLFVRSSCIIEESTDMS